MGVNLTGFDKSTHESRLNLVLDLTSESNNRPAAMIDAITKVYGFKHVAYLGVNLPNKLTSNGPFAIATYSTDWIEHYTSRNFVSFDPVIHKSFKTILPSDWNEFDQREKRVRDLFAEARLFGVGRQGLSLPVRGPRAELALFTVTSDESALGWSALKSKHMGELQILAQHLHLEVTNNRNAPVAGEYNTLRLSRREIDVLTWAAAGKTVADTALILSLSAHTVRTYLEMARARLNALNTTHAVARALALELIHVQS